MRELRFNQLKFVLWLVINKLIDVDHVSVPIIHC